MLSRLDQRRTIWMWNQHNWLGASQQYQNHPAECSLNLRLSYFPNTTCRLNERGLPAQNYTPWHLPQTGCPPTAICCCLYRKGSMLPSPNSFSTWSEPRRERAWKDTYFPGGGGDREF